MQYYMRVQSGFVVESESELGAATGLIRRLDVRRAPGEEEPHAVSIMVSQDLVHWTLYRLPAPEQPSEPAASAEDALRARAEAAEARAAQAEADARLMLHELVALDESEGTNVVGYWRGLGLTDAECGALRVAFDRSPPGREEEELAVVRRILATAKTT